MIVVSDTSPLNYLILIGAVDVLPQLFGGVHIPEQVLAELLDPGTPEPVKKWAQSPPQWLRIRAQSVEIRATAGLDAGESQAIALAIELQAPAVLIDEKKGRRIAKSYGLATVGTITLLELAARHGLLDLKTAFRSLAETTFHIKESYLEAALKRSAERKDR